MAVGIIYICSVCGDEITSYSGYNYDGVFSITNGGKPADNFYMCPACANEVREFIYDLQHTFDMYDVERCGNN